MEARRDLPLPGRLLRQIRAYDPIERLASAVAISLLIVLGTLAAEFAVRTWTLEDMDVYLAAGARLLAGETPYSVTNPFISYQYAPWFAALWAPLTYLPRGVVAVGWSAILLGASVAAVSPLLRQRTPASLALAVLMGGILVSSSARSGNVQPLLIAGLVLGVERRSGPLWIALAASLKGLPLALAVIYAGRGQWGRVAVSVALTAVLIGPMLAFDLANYTTDSSRAGTLMRSLPVLWGLLFSGLAGVAFIAARRASRLAWLAGALTVVMGLPRLLAYDTTYLLVGTAEPAKSADDRATEPGVP